jgi:hypothetical protein
MSFYNFRPAPFGCNPALFVMASTLIADQFPPPLHPWMVKWRNEAIRHSRNRLSFKGDELALQKQEAFCSRPVTEDSPL